MSTRVVKRQSVVSLYGLLLLALAGCGRSGDLEMAAVSGTVTYQGKPIEDGEIRFAPTGDTKGPASAAMIRNGRYEVTARGGVPVGTHRVEVRAFRVIPGAAPLDDRPGVTPGELPKEQYLPPKLNDQSDLRITIDPGHRKMTQDFNLGDQ
jgi:hypothetical protein